jgi:hypothetical protein
MELHSDDLYGIVRPLFMHSSGGLMRLKTIRPFQLAAFAVCVAVIAVAAMAQAPARVPAGVRFTATTENVGGAGEAIKINLTNWSNDADRDQMVAAWSLTPSAAAGARGGRGAAAAAGGRGGGRGGRGGAAAAPADDPAADPDDPAFRFGRGGARGRGAEADAATPSETPQGALAAALKKAPTVGLLWTSETVGYSIKYAYRLPQPDGGERIILATDRRLGAWNNNWTPVGSPASNDYQFSVLELRFNAKGDGEGKVSVTGKVAIDSTAKTIALESYSGLPVILKGVKRQSGS